MNSLADGWRFRRLDELVMVERRAVHPNELPPDTRYVGLEHVESGTGMHTSITVADAKLRSGKFTFHAGEILFGKLRPNLRKVAVANCSGVCSTDLIPLCPKEPETSFLIAFQLRSIEFTNNAIRLVTGQNLPRISVRDLMSLHIPVPPKSKLEMLRNLAALLDEARATSYELDKHVRQLHEAATAMLYPISSISAPLRLTKSI